MMLLRCGARRVRGEEKKKGRMLDLIGEKITSSLGTIKLEATAVQALQSLRDEESCGEQVAK